MEDVKIRDSYVVPLWKEINKLKKIIKDLEDNLLGTLRLLSLSIDTNIPKTIKMGVEKLIKKLEGK